MGKGSIILTTENENENSLTYKLPNLQRFFTYNFLLTRCGKISNILIFYDYEGVVKQEIEIKL